MTEPVLNPENESPGNSSPGANINTAASILNTASALPEVSNPLIDAQPPLQAISLEAWKTGFRSPGFSTISEIQTTFAGSPAEFLPAVGTALGTGLGRMNELISLANFKGLTFREAAELRILSLRAQEVSRRSHPIEGTPAIPLTVNEMIPEQQATLTRIREDLRSQVAGLNNFEQLEQLNKDPNLRANLPYVNGRTEFQEVITAVASRAQELYLNSGAREITGRQWLLGVRPEGFVDFNVLASQPGLGDTTRQVMVDLYKSTGVYELQQLINKMARGTETLSYREAQRLRIASLRISAEVNRRRTQPADTLVTETLGMIPEQEANLALARSELTSRFAGMTIEQLNDGTLLQQISINLPYVDGVTENQLFMELKAEKAQALYDQTGDTGISVAHWNAGARPAGFVSDYYQYTRISANQNVSARELLGDADFAKLKAFESRTGRLTTPLSPTEAAEFSALTQKIKEKGLALRPQNNEI